MSLVFLHRYHEIAKITSPPWGLCFVDFACSAPYIDRHKHASLKRKALILDAIYFSPHKFLGGPGSNGVLIFNSSLYKNRVPDHPGGGTVDWTNPWGRTQISRRNWSQRRPVAHQVFCKTIRIALAIGLKEKWVWTTSSEGTRNPLISYGTNLH